MVDTLLVLTGMGIPQYSARGLTQTLTPIAAKSLMKRTVNGVLVDLSASQFEKYQSEISGHDCDPPAIDGIWQGMQLTVDCIPELGYLSAGGSPERTVVAGSSRISDLFTFYRPQIIFLVTNFSNSKDEWGASVAWTLSLEEV